MNVDSVIFKPKLEQVGLKKANSEAYLWNNTPYQWDRECNSFLQMQSCNDTILYIYFKRTILLGRFLSNGFLNLFLI